MQADCEYGKHLYVLQMGELVKVGRSNFPTLRLSEHRNGNFWGSISLVATFEDAGFIEPWVLKALSSHETRSEWIHCSVQEALEAIGQCLV